MPLLRYFAWVGSFLLAALLAANWCCAPIPTAQGSDIPLDRKINIRIHTDHKWPERVVLDTSRSALPPELAGTPDGAPRETLVEAQLQPMDAFAEMPQRHVRPCFRPPCATDREASPTETRTRDQDRSNSSVAARKNVTFPNPPHRPRGRS